MGSIVHVTINGERRELPGPLTVAELLRHLAREAGIRRRRAQQGPGHPVAPRRDRRSRPGDVLEIVTLVGGGSPAAAPTSLAAEPLKIGTHLVPQPAVRRHGQVRDARADARLPGGQRLPRWSPSPSAASGCSTARAAACSTILDPQRYTILPNTAGCFSAEDALRTARLGRELLEGLDNPGADWVKLEVLADTRTLLPDPVATLRGDRVLVKEGFQVLCYTSDDPIMARRLKEAGAASVMPAGSPIGSGQGVLNPNNIRIILEDLKDGRPGLSGDRRRRASAPPATWRSPWSWAATACCSTPASPARQDPLRMAHAMRLAIEAGRLAYGAGRIPRKLYATASSPTQGVIGRS